MQRPSEDQAWQIPPKDALPILPVPCLSTPLDAQDTSYLAESAKTSNLRIVSSLMPYAP